MTPTEKAIIDFCGHHADWWPSTTQVQEMLALAQPCSTCEALARTVMLDQTSHDTHRRTWVGLTDNEIKEIIGSYGDTPIKGYTRKLFNQIEAALRSKNT